MVHGQNSSVTTIFTIINSMVGGAMLTFPIQFKNTGLITSIIVLAISALISYKTCRIYAIHLSKKDTDVDDTIERLMGYKWLKGFRFITGFYLVLLNMIYIDLIVDQLYDIIYYIFNQSGYGNLVAPKDSTTLVFDKFSQQYLSLIMFLPLLAMTFIKNLTFLIKLTSYGVLSVFIYIIFIFYAFGTSFPIQSSKIVWISSDIGSLAGTSAVAFTIHTVVATILKANKNQQNNNRDLKLSYFLGFLMYTGIGIIGCLAVLTKKCQETIVNCYLDDWTSLIVEISYLYGRLTVFPCFIQVGRSRILLNMYPEISKTNFRVFNILFMTFSIFVTFFSPYVHLDTIMGLVGSVVCFIFIYYIPTMLHYYCFYRVKKDEEKISLNRQQANATLITQSEISQNQQDNKQKCQCSHSPKQKDQYPKWFRFLGYGLLNIIGIVIGIYGIYSVFA